MCFNEGDCHVSFKQEVHKFLKLFRSVCRKRVVAEQCGNALLPTVLTNLHNRLCNSTTVEDVSRTHAKTDTFVLMFCLRQCLFLYLLFIQKNCKLPLLFYYFRDFLFR